MLRGSLLQNLFHCTFFPIPIIQYSLPCPITITFNREWENCKSKNKGQAKGHEYSNLRENKGF